MERQLKFKKQFKLWDLIATGIIIAIIFTFLALVVKYVFADEEVKRTIQLDSDLSYTPVWGQPVNDERNNILAKCYRQYHWSLKKGNPDKWAECLLHHRVDWTQAEYEDAMSGEIYKKWKAKQNWFKRLFL